MKLRPILEQYCTALPQFTDLFTETIDITNLTQTSGVGEATTLTPHSFSVGDIVTLSGAVGVVPLTSLVPSNSTQVIGRSAIDNGLSMAMNFKDKSTDLTVDLIGSNEAEFNGTFKLLSVPNRFAFIAEILNVGSPASGSPQLLNYAFGYYNGSHVITGVPTTTTFNFPISPLAPPLNTGTIKAHFNYRIGAAITLDRAEDFYTRQVGNNKYWLILLPGVSTPSKDRNILNDSTYTAQLKSVAFRQRLIENYHCLIFAPSSNDTSGAQTIETVEDVKVALISSMGRFPNTTPFNATEEDFVYTYGGGEILTYNTAYVVYQFTFDTNFDITYNDLWDSGKYAPFRNIEQDLEINDEGQLLANINLDTDPDF